MSNKPNVTNDQLWTYLDMATAFANSVGSCSRNNTGAILITNDGVVKAIAVNHLVKGNCANGDCPRGRKSYAEVPAYSDYSDCKAIHAEMNCINAVQEDKTGMWMLVTREPCDRCKRVISMAGIRYLWVRNYTVRTPITIEEAMKKYPGTFVDLGAGRNGDGA